MSEPLPVYDGLRLLGEIKPLGGKCAAAIAADGKRLGKFPNQADAMHAIKAHAIAASPTSGAPNATGRPSKPHGRA
jgi:hypothetical protein